ncbi:hypothetical protein D3C85_1040320 [compost metagenome]
MFLVTIMGVFPENIPSQTKKHDSFGVMLLFKPSYPMGFANGSNNYTIEDPIVLPDAIIESMTYFAKIPLGLTSTHEALEQ